MARLGMVKAENRWNFRSRASPVDGNRGDPCVPRSINAPNVREFGQCGICGLHLEAVVSTRDIIRPTCT